MSLWQTCMRVAARLQPVKKTARENAMAGASLRTCLSLRGQRLQGNTHVLEAGWGGGGRCGFLRSLSRLR
jgi:hypothetical protein